MSLKARASRDENLIALSLGALYSTRLTPSRRFELMSSIFSTPEHFLVDIM